MAKYTLKDGMPRKNGEAVLNVSKNGNLLEIGADGYGEMTAETGHGFPVVIEFYNGKLTLRVFSDINSEDPTHTINLDGALESARKPEPSAPAIADTPGEEDPVAQFDAA